jgi:hypothetical protein
MSVTDAPNLTPVSSSIAEMLTMLYPPGPTQRADLEEALRHFREAMQRAWEGNDPLDLAIDAVEKAPR